MAQKPKPNKTFFNNWVKGEYTQNPGIGAIDRAYAGGRSYQQILGAATNQGFSFEPGSLKILQQRVEEEKARNNKTFFKNWVNGDNVQTPGIGAIDRAYAGGRTYQQILGASAIQDFDFEPGALKYLNQKVTGERNAENQSIADEYQKRFDDLETKMADNQKKYTESLSTMANTLMTSQDKAQAALMAANYRGTREPVLGIKSATTKDSPDIKKLARQGMGGSFNRAGLRIKGLNIG